jgi:serine protease inhibitor
MTLNGAGGETAAQMRKALRLESLAPQKADQVWADLIATSNATKRAQLRIADSLWLRDGVTYVPSFLAANRDYFAADAYNLPADVTQAPAQINDWVAARTGDRIKDLVSSVPPETALVLVNTVYAKVGWDHFDKAKTGPKPFTLAGGSTVEVPTMEGSMIAEVAATAEYDAVPVQTHGELTFWVVVPKGSQTPETVAALLRERGVASLSRHTTYAAVDLQVPRFKIEYASQDLNGDLAAMGMPDAFSPEVADFSGMAQVHPLWIGSVLQKAMIDVSEKGVEAAAGSAVMMAGAAPPTKQLTVRADRPFLIVLSGQFTAAPLFMALVRDPR